MAEDIYDAINPRRRPKPFPLPHPLPIEPPVELQPVKIDSQEFEFQVGDILYDGKTGKPKHNYATGEDYIY
jgi:hypothetical protein